MNKIAGYYARVSKEKDDQILTIHSQIAEIKERIIKDKNILDENCQFIDDDWSGEMLQRPGLDFMRDAARDGRFQILYVYDRGRLSRIFAHQEVVLEELYDKQIEFVTLHDVNASTPEEKVLQAMQGVFHQYERVKIAERMRRGKLYKARSGKIVGYNPPYGYTYIYKTKDSEGHFIINEKEADVVRIIYKWIAEDCLTINKVIKRLYELGITPRKGKRPIWTNGPLSRLVRNEAYIGTAYYNKGYAVVPKNPKRHDKYKKFKRSSRALRPKNEWIPITVPSIIDTPLFDRVQKQLEINALYSRRNKKHDYLLSHLIWCDCGSRMFGEGSGSQFYYRCTDRLKNYPMPKKCMGGGLNVARVENVVWNKIKDLLSNPLLVENKAKEWHYNESQQPNNQTILEKERLHKALEELKNQESRYVKAFGEGLIIIELFRKHIDDINKKRWLIQEQIDKSSVQEKNTLKQNLPPFEMLRIQIPVVLNYLSEQDKQFVLRKTIKQIVVNKERSSATIKGCIPLQISKDLEKNPKCGYESINRYHRFTQCRQIYSF